jgi:2-methylcitrate dehydratase PrpD
MKTQGAPMDPGDKASRNAGLAVSYITRLQFDEIPPQTVKMVKCCLMDYFSACIAGIGFPASKSGLGILGSFGRKEEATVIGCRKKVPAIAAVWANALLGNVLDFEDGHYPSLSHPASVVFPVAMAFSEKLNVDPKELITTVVIGYDILGRSGALMARKYRERTHGFGAPSVYAAAAVAARLLGLERARVEMALGVAGCHMPSIPVLRSNEYGAMTKGGGPWGAFAGSMSALLAAEGFTAPPATLQDPFISGDDESAVSQLLTLGTEFAIDHVYFKRYPACRWAHAPLDAVQAIMSEHAVRPDQVADILVETFQEALSLAQKAPKTIEGIEFSSIPMPLALMLVDGEFGVDQLSSDRLEDPKVLQIASKVRMILDPELDKMFPKRRPARVTLTTCGGAAYTKEILEVHGEPGSEFAKVGITEKFFRIVTSRFGENVANRLHSAIQNLDHLSSLGELFDLLKTQPRIMREQDR